VRRAAKKDSVQAEIVKALRQCGVTVFIVNHEALPDLLTYWRGRWLPIEIKTERRRRTLSDRGGATLTPAQCETYRVAPFPIVKTVDQALSHFGFFAREAMK
jgi:hypothetical protein